MLLEGVNDIGISEPSGFRKLALDGLTDRYRPFVARARPLSLRTISGTMTPLLHPGDMSRMKNQLRRAANDFIRTSGTFDSVIGLDAAVREPAHPDDQRAPLIRATII